MHWSKLYQEKKRAGHSLVNALSSPFESIQLGPVIGTTISPNHCKIASSLLDSFLETTGKR